MLPLGQDHSRAPHAGTLIRGISSMATRRLLAELSASYERRSACHVAFESVGGVDAARRVQAGEVFDAVVLASDAIDKLIQGGSVLAGSKVDLVRSGVAIAVRAGAQRPRIATQEELRAAVLAAPGIGYSTGPSGTELMKLFESWGIAGQIQERLVQAPGGVPVGALVAEGKVALGFQQLSELMHLEGIDIVGSMPASIQIVTTFSGAVCAASTEGEAARRMLDFMASPAASDSKRRHGMEPA